LRFLNGDTIIGSSWRGSAVKAGCRRETKAGRGFVEIGSEVLLELKAEASLGVRKKNICFGFNVK
jgi:hypothetical protein